MSTAHIALVDDDPTFSSYITALLNSRGYEVASYASGQALLDALGHSPSPDVVLLDVLMPGMTGLETLKALRNAQSGVQVIMLSGQQVPATIVDSVRLGAVDYVLTPDDPDGIGEAALAGAIRNALEKVTLTPEVARLRAQVAEDDRPRGDDAALPGVRAGQGGADPGGVAGGDAHAHDRGDV